MEPVGLVKVPEVAAARAVVEALVEAHHATRAAIELWLRDKTAELHSPSDERTSQCSHPAIIVL